MSDARGEGPSRRGVLTGAGLLLVAACTGSSPSAAPPPLTSDQRLARRVADEIGELTVAYEATIAAHPGLGTSVGLLAAEHQAHVRALVALLPAPTSTPSGSPAAAATSAPSPPAVPPTAGAARSALAAAELAASKRRSAQAVVAGPELARLLASIAACEAVHAALVAG